MTAAAIALFFGALLCLLARGWALSREDGFVPHESWAEPVYHCMASAGAPLAIVCASVACALLLARVTLGPPTARGA